MVFPHVSCRYRLSLPDGDNGAPEDALAGNVEEAHLVLAGRIGQRDFRFLLGANAMRRNPGEIP
ncbi:hypothetical protein [Pontibaca methylaminivorans]|uniref:hypothetical protein n=1 Tax=Pontibaca methylaminivorans TaxID=515897 RepID=UPI002FD97741